MIVDSSAVMAILQDEPDGAALANAIANAAGRPLMSAVNLVEVSIVFDNREPGGTPDRLHSLISELGIEIVAFDAGMATLARDAHRRFGRNRHPAGLNFGDCCAYALAKATGEPLLFKGNDFIHTDITPALS